MKRILIILIVLAAVVYWQWPAISNWWDDRQVDQIEQDLQDEGALQEDGSVTVDGELDPELNDIQDELDATITDLESELENLENE